MMWVSDYLLLSMAAAAGPSQHGAPASLDCALNGVKAADGSCTCDPAWEGAQCERFAFVSTSDDADLNSPWASTDLETSTWGMGTLQRPLDGGQQHMFGVELTGSCGIGAWQTNSQVVHWISDAPTSPWRRLGVALAPQATCPSAAITPNGTLIMTLFGGVQRASKQRTPEYYPSGDPVHHNFCRNGSTPCGFSKHGCSSTSVLKTSSTIRIGGQDSSGLGDQPAVDAATGLPDCAHCTTRPSGGRCAFPMYAADEAEGPWRLTSVVLDLTMNFTGAFSISAPWVSTNGTTHIVLQTGQFPDAFPPKYKLNNIGAIIRADSWVGPYTVVARGACGAGEDMFIWEDQRGHFHCIWHNTGKTSANHGPHQDGAHSFSVDGRDPWFCVDGKGGHGACTEDTPAPYNTTLWHTRTRNNGNVTTATVMGTRERPHMLFNNDGSPLALVTATRYCNGSAATLCASDVSPGYSDRSFSSVAYLRQKTDDDETDTSSHMQPIAHRPPHRSGGKGGGCAADHGKDTPCCGQTSDPGTEVSPKYQCPAAQPTCVDYVFNHHLGHCTGGAATPPLRPSWAPTFVLRNSTFAYLCNFTGFFDPVLAGQFALVGFDQSNQRGIGYQGEVPGGGGWKHSDPEQSTCDASMLQQASLVKRVNPNTRVLLYRNAEAAQQWQASSRALLHNVSDASLLLRRPNGSIFCEPHNNNNYSDGCYYFWAFNSSRCREAVIEQVYMAGIETDVFDGYFLDDTPGLWCEHQDHSATLRMSAADVSAVVAGTGEMINALYPRLIARGKFAWQAFNNWPFQSRGGAPTAGSTLTKHTCAKTLRTFAAMGAADAPFLWFLTLDEHHKPSQLHQDLAGFLITRGDHAFIGTGWMDDAVPPFPSEYHAEYGSPLAPMAEGPAGVFQRAWSGSTVKLDCNMFIASGIKST